MTSEAWPSFLPEGSPHTFQRSFEERLLPCALFPGFDPSWGGGCLLIKGHVAELNAMYCFSKARKHLYYQDLWVCGEWSLGRVTLAMAGMGESSCIVFAKG